MSNYTSVQDDNGMIQHSIWGSYGRITWELYCWNEARRMRSHGIKAEVIENNRGKIAIWREYLK